MNRLRSLLLVAVVATATALAACTADQQAGPQDPPTAARGAGTASPPDAAADATTAPSPRPRPRTRKVHPVSLPALFDNDEDAGGGLRVGRVLMRTDAYTQRFVTYRSSGLRISGILNVPRGRGPFPTLVLAHGYIDPAVYDNGQGLRREQDFLAREGYVVLHTDYRNHARSEDDPGAERRLRLGYTEDVANAVRALRRSSLRYVDRDRIGLLGRSMGGGVVYNVLVTQPGLVDAAVVFAPVSSWTPDNFNRWIRDDPGRSRLSDAILERYGSPRQNRRFWARVSPRTYFERITEPVLIHHGTADESCPIRWSRTTLRFLDRAGVDAQMFTYPGEPHAFIADWPLSMRRTDRFFRQHL